MKRRSSSSSSAPACAHPRASSRRPGPRANRTRRWRCHRTARACPSPRSQTVVERILDSNAIARSAACAAGGRRRRRAARAGRPSSAGNRQRDLQTVQRKVQTDHRLLEDVTHAAARPTGIAFASRSIRALTPPCGYRQVEGAGDHRVEFHASMRQASRRKSELNFTTSSRPFEYGSVWDCPVRCAGASARRLLVQTIRLLHIDDVVELGADHEQRSRRDAGRVVLRAGREEVVAVSSAARRASAAVAPDLRRHPRRASRHHVERVIDSDSPVVTRRARPPRCACGTPSTPERPPDAEPAVAAAEARPAQTTARGRWSTAAAEIAFEAP